ncbi:MAG TPA: Bax inhibitor-1/YccA family protein [Sphingomicrobium sp.]|nr:Bax inhibitor-1/YccA family protein [Sphingomicrobium sp.]
MQNQYDPRTTGVNPAVSVGVPRAARDAGLRSYMLSVYNYMASGVLLTGIVALGLAMTGVAQSLWYGGGILRWVVIFAPLIMVMIMGFRAQRMSTGAMQAFFWAFAAVMGVSMSVIPLVYDGTSIAQCFFATAVAFLSLSLWGYTTKRDLSGFGTFLIMGVVGLFVVMLGNLFIRSDALSMVISVVGVFLFAGLTAYDTQKIKSTYAYVAGTDMMGKTAILGALTLYLDFINMFQFLLSLLGNRE